MNTFRNNPILNRIEMLLNRKRITPIYSYIGSFAVFSFLLYMISFSVEKSSNNAITTVISNNASSSSLAETTASINENKTYAIVDETATPKGGFNEFYKYLANNISIPRSLNDVNEGKVYIEFVVDKDGTITNPTVVKSLDPRFDAIVLKIISGAPKWNDAKFNGKFVRQKIVLPINYQLS